MDAIGERRAFCRKVSDALISNIRKFFPLLAEYTDLLRCLRIRKFGLSFTLVT